MKIVGRAGLGVEGGRQAADVPAVAHRDQRQHRDLGVLGGVQRALEHVEREVLAQSESGSSYQSAWVTKCCSGRSTASRSSTSWSEHALLLVRDHLLGHRDDPERQRHAARRAAGRAPARSRSRTPSSAACTSRRRTAARPRGAARGRAPPPRRPRPCAGRRRPGAPPSGRAPSRPCRSPRRRSASTIATESGDAERSAIRAAG